MTVPSQTHWGGKGMLDMFDFRETLVSGPAQVWLTIHVTISNDRSLTVPGPGGHKDRGVQRRSDAKGWTDVGAME